jgi:peptide/nickel transport system substrate-binding protein
MIDRISVQDDLRATVHFRQPYADYLAVLGSYFFPAHYFSTFAATDVGTMAYPFTADLAKAVTIGPFKYQEAAGRDVKLVKDPRWHGPAEACPGGACLDAVLYRIFPNDKAGLIKSFNDGDLDVALGLDDTDYGAIADVATTGQAILGPAWSYEHFDMNEAGGGTGHGHPALRDVVVRRAISQAIDRRALYQAVHASALPVSPDTDLVACTNATSSNYWRLPDATCLDYDVDAANMALDAAGYKRGADGIRVDPRSGQPLVFEHCTTAAPYREVSGKFLKDAFDKIGIKLNLNFLAREVLLAAATDVGATAKCNLARGNFDTAEFAYVLGFDLHDNYYYPYHSGQIPTEANGWIGYNFIRFDDEGVDRAIDALSSAINPEELVNDAYDIQRAYLHDVPEIALYYRDQTRGTISGLRNFLMHPGATFGAGSDTWNIEDWWLGD